MGNWIPRGGEKDEDLKSAYFPDLEGYLGPKECLLVLVAGIMGRVWVRKFGEDLCNLLEMGRGVLEKGETATGILLQGEG